MKTAITKRVDRHTHVSKEKLVVLPSFPDAVKIELTSYCNYRCSFCSTKNIQRPMGNMSKSFLYRILHEAKSLGVKEIGLFFMGESFLVDELAEYIRYAKEEVGIDYVFLTTNGSLCTPDRLIPVIEAGLDSLKFSINAGSRSSYKKMHNADNFEKVVSHVKWLHEYKKENNLEKPINCVSTIYNNDNKEELELFKKSISPYVDEFYYLPLYNQGGTLNDIEYAKITGNPGRLENMVAPFPCWSLFSTAKISWDGWLNACCFDIDGSFHIADLNEISLLDAWHHQDFAELRRQHLNNDIKNTSCAKCLKIH